MKKFYIFAAAFFLGLCTLALAGTAPEAVVSRGCHGRVVAYEPIVESACHGQRTLLTPAVEAACGCHGRGGRLTLAERRTARSAARANYQTTLAQFHDAARRGSVSAVSVSAPPTMQVVEVVEKEVKCDCKCDPCKCK